jgi:hypothetical protein
MAKEIEFTYDIYIGAPAREVWNGLVDAELPIRRFAASLPGVAPKRSHGCSSFRRSAASLHSRVCRNRRRIDGLAKFPLLFRCPTRYTRSTVASGETR